MTGVSTLVGLAIQIALLVVTLTVVRRDKPGAVAPLAASFGIGIASTVLGVVVYPLLGVVTLPVGGIETYVSVQKVRHDRGIHADPRRQRRAARAGPGEPREAGATLPYGTTQPLGGHRACSPVGAGALP